MPLRHAEFGFAAAMFAFGLFILAQSVRYGIFGPTVTGAGFFPALSGLLMLGASAAILRGHLTGRRGGEEAIVLRPLWPVLAIVGLTVLFLLVVERVGMLLLTPFYVGAVAAVIDPPRRPRAWLRVGLVAGGFTLFAWALFRHGLNIPLPRGLL